MYEYFVIDARTSINADEGDGGMDSAWSMLWQLAMQFMVETTLIAGFATLTAFVPGPWLGKMLLLAVRQDLAARFVVHTDFGVMAAAAGFGILAAILAGLAPVAQLAQRYGSLQLSKHSKDSTVGAGFCSNEFRLIAFVAACCDELADSSIRSVDSAGTAVCQY